MVSTPVDDFGSRPSSADAEDDAAAGHPQKTVRFAKCKVVYPGKAMVLNIYKDSQGRYIHQVRLLKGRHIGVREVDVRLGYTTSWEHGQIVHVYVIPQAYGRKYIYIYMYIYIYIHVNVNLCMKI